MGWKTITGGILGTLGWVLGQPEITLDVIMQGAGAIFGVVGFRHAMTKPRRDS